jgi:pimeloyl-ACP methyl ester carboxylesterase
MKWVILAALAAAVLSPFVFPDLVARLAPLLLYFPQSLGDRESAPGVWGLENAEEVWITTEDGIRLHAWWAPARTSAAGSDGAPARGSLPGSPAAAIFFHGNAGHLAGRAPIAERLRRLGLEVLLLDYRGFGRSEGRPSEAGLYRDGRAALSFVERERGIPARRILLAGHSLGGAVATAVAAERLVGGLVVTSTFRSLPSIAHALHRWLPGRFFSWSINRFDSEIRMADVQVPVLVGWGTEDEFIPRAQPRALYEAAGEPKRWIEVAGAGHNDLWWAPELWEEIASFVSEVVWPGMPYAGAQAP